MAPRKPSMGRKKIEMKPIEIEESRQVTFSKRRLGLFRKASELSELCGVEVASIVFSPAGKAFSYGRPSVDAIVNRLLADNAVPAVGGGGEGSSSSAPAAMAAELQELNTTYAELRVMVEQEKLRKEQADEEMKRELEAAGYATAAWLDADLAELSEAELEEFEAALMEMKDVVQLHADAMLREALASTAAAIAAPAPAPTPAPPLPFPMPRRFPGSVFEVGGSSSGTNNGGFSNSLFEVGGSSSGANNGGFSNSLFEVGGSSSGANNGGFGNSLFLVGGSSSGANNGGFGNSLFQIDGSSSGANNGGFHNSLFQVGGSSSGNNNGGFTGLFEVGGSSFRINNGGTAMEDMQMQMDDDMLLQQLDTMAQLDPRNQIPPPPPPPGMGFPETMELPPLPAQLPPPRMVFPETMDLPPPDFGPDGGFFGPPPY